MDTRLAILIMVSGLFLSACDQELQSESKWKKPATETISCEDYHSETTPNGILFNNVWNNSAAGFFSWSQCLEKNPANGNYGWSWVWPNIYNFTYAYPQIKTGASPWDSSPEPESGFPLRFSETRSLVIAHELEILGDSELNVVTSIWLTNPTEIDGNPDPFSIIAELKIWNFTTQDHMNPGGSHIDDVEIEGERWGVWVEKNNRRYVSGTNSNRWVYVAFRAENLSLKANFDAVKFMNYAIKQKIIPQEFNINNVELGTEIMSGSGLAWVKKYSVSIEK